MLKAFACRNTTRTQLLAFGGRMRMRQREVTSCAPGPCYRIGFLTSQEFPRLGLGPLLLQERCGTSYTDQQTLFLLWSGLWLVR